MIGNNFHNNSAFVALLVKLSWSNETLLLTCQCESTIRCCPIGLLVGVKFCPTSDGLFEYNPNLPFPIESKMKLCESKLVCSNNLEHYSFINIWKYNQERL